MRKLLLLLALLPTPLWADAAEDKGFLTRWLQENLSGAGREVTIEGFRGALSSQASLSELTIADEAGVWLTLRNVTLDWNRAALLRGRIEVETLTAAEIDVARLPQPQAASPEAKPFSLPDLPVAVAIDKVSAPQIHLGPTVLGQDVVASLEANVTLEDAAGTAKILLDRKDKGGALELNASYSDRLALDLALNEPEGGIAATKLGLPGAPATRLTIAGEGPLTDFAAKVDLATDGVTRLGGQISVKADPQGRRFAANLAGDPTPVFLPAYATFFGPDVSLAVEGVSGAAGLDLEKLEIVTAALKLSGQAKLSPSYQPEKISLSGRLGLPIGKVTLPLSTEAPVTLASADLTLRHDAAIGPDWQLDATVNELDTGHFTGRQVALHGEGALIEGHFGGTARMSALGLDAPDPALARLIGPLATLTTTFHTETSADKSGLVLDSLALTAPGLGLQAAGKIALDGFDGTVSGHIDDLTRAEGLRAGLGGALRFDLSGTADPLSGAFDLGGTLISSDLTLGQAQADALLAGSGQVAIAIARDQNGITIKTLEAKTPAITANLTGAISSEMRRLSGDVALPDLAVLGYRGALQAQIGVTGSRIEVSGTGQDLSFGQPDLDKLLRGGAELRLAADLDSQVIEEFAVSTQELTASASGPLTELALKARLANLGLFVPAYPGAVTLEGTAGWKNGALPVDLDLRGPGQISARVTGTVDGSATRLTAKGSATAALANPFLRPRSVAGNLRFDLALAGLDLKGLSGTVSLGEGRFADASLPFSLQGIDASARLSGGTARIEAKAQASTGGDLSASGTIGLAAPYTAKIGITLTALKLRDPQLYETSVWGDLDFAGPALGGAKISGTLRLGRTELRIPSGLSSSAAVAGLRHVGDSAAVRQSRARGASKSTSTSSSGGASYGLAIRILAPNQVFLRGRGLDAELGGELMLGGTTKAISPEGGFRLLRGRMDILGRRLVLSEANLDLRGELVPIVHVVASVEATDITATVTVDGPANAPEVSFTSSPDLPQEEVLAQLLFGKALESISPFQAAQLASAVATLSGRGGDGLLGRIRSKTGLDDLDVQTDGTGGGSLTAGKYLSEKLYSEVTVGSDGKSDISLNLDVARHITLKAKVDTEGNSGAGVVLKKDY